MRVPVTGKNDILFQLYGHLTQRQKIGQTTVLIVDEAHLLSPQVLEEIRLLGNLENQRSKLLQIVLAGQPEFDNRLDSAYLRQLKQRIALRCQLQPLTLERTGEYIDWRCGARRRSRRFQRTPIFPLKAISEVFEYSQGYPRLINTICENALIFACANETRTVSRDLVAAACKDLRMQRCQPAVAGHNGQPNSGSPPSSASTSESQKMSVELVQACASKSAVAASAPEVNNS